MKFSNLFQALPQVSVPDLLQPHVRLSPSRSEKSEIQCNRYTVQLRSTRMTGGTPPSLFRSELQRSFQSTDETAYLLPRAFLRRHKFLRAAIQLPSEAMFWL